jgi:uncharacterized membrane protein YeaQ/YmgE (transglycosylase-associated protein family)
MIVNIATLLLLLSKIPDLHSTWIRISGAHQERNLLVRSIIYRTGPQRGLILAMILYLARVASAHTLCKFLDGRMFNIQYLITATIVAVFNLAVAHANYTGRSNRLSQCILDLFRMFYK